jgi:DNA-binding PadR family transcriptional regulator
VLAEQPMNGYQIIQEITERSDGMWKPSPGSIYPTLQQLEDEGLARTEVQEGRRTFQLTDEGRAYVDSHADEMAAVWEAMSPSGDDDADDVRPLIGQAAAALWQIMATGSPAQKARAREVLAETRRTLYGILADGDDEPTEEGRES